MEISYRSIFKVFFAILVVALLFFTQKLILTLFAAFVISTVTNPVADWMENKKIPRTIATIFIFLGVLVFLGLAFSWIVPTLASEISSLALGFPGYIEENIAKYPFFSQYGLRENIYLVVIGISNFLKDQAPSIVVSTVSFLGNLFYVFVALTIAFYLTDEKNLIKGFLRKIINKNYHNDLVTVFSEIEYKMGKWFIGQLFLSLVSGVAIFFGLTILGVPFALPLATLAAILRFVPYLGGLISDSIGILIAFLSSPWLGVAAFLMYYIIQQIEGYIVIPMVMQRTIGLNPIMVIVAVLVGGQLGGIAGALFALPVMIVIVILVKKFVLEENKA